MSGNGNERMQPELLLQRGEEIYLSRVRTELPGRAILTVLVVNNPVRGKTVFSEEFDIIFSENAQCQLKADITGFPRVRSIKKLGATTAKYSLELDTGEILISSASCEAYKTQSIPTLYRETT
jgi:hypothetical protein